MKPAADRPWSVVVARAEVPETGRRFVLSADEDSRARIAKIAGLNGLPRLEAIFDVTRQAGEGLRVRGEVSATVTQTCVVTLELVENEVREAVDLDFVPAAEGSNGEVDVANDNGPETMANGMVDLGAIAVEFLMLGLDPYPRKPGVVFEPLPGADDGRNRPFAALAALKKATGAKDG